MALRRPVFYIEPDAAEELLSTDEALDHVVMAAQMCAEAAGILNPETGGEDMIVASGRELVDGIATSYVGNTSGIWHIIEFGSRNNSPYRPMTQGVEQVLGRPPMDER